MKLENLKIEKVSVNFNKANRLHKFILGTITTCLFTILTASTCVRNHSGNLEKVGVYSLTMEEPSGLALDPNGEFLYIVSDQKSNIYKTNLQGVVQKKIDVKAADYEGIAINFKNDLFYTVDESKNKIRCFDLGGNETHHIKLSENVSKKSGPEGIDVDWEDGSFYVVNEKSPVMIYHLNDKFQEIRSQKIEHISDLSGITINPKTKDLWLLSDEDQKVIHVDKKFNIQNEYLIDVKQMEGIAIDFKKRILYIVSDAEEELHIFTY